MIKKSLTVSAFIFLSFCPAVKAQYDFSFSGYAVNLPMFQVLNADFARLFGAPQNIFMDMTRVRLKPTLNLWEGARVNLEWDFSALYSDSENNFLFSQPGKTNRQLINMTWQPVNEKHFSVTHTIDRLYFRQSFSAGSIEIGRQRISWGTGRIWNPTDLFNPVNPALYYKLEKDGADVVSAKFAFGNFTDLNIVVNPMEKIGDSNYGFRFRTNYNTYDISVMGGMFDKRIVAGMDFAGNLFDAGFRGEGIISADKNDFKSNYVKFILGIDNQFTPELYGMLEYHYNGQGTKSRMNYDLTKLVKGEILNLSKNYLYSTISYLVTPLLTASLSDNHNFDDGSGFIGISANYSLSDNTYVNAGAQITYGGKFSEYWYYPKSVYLQAEYYF